MARLEQEPCLRPHFPSTLVGMWPRTVDYLENNSYIVKNLTVSSFSPNPSIRIYRGLIGSDLTLRCRKDIISLLQRPRSLPDAHQPFVATSQQQPLAVPRALASARHFAKHFSKNRSLRWPNLPADRRLAFVCFVLGSVSSVRSSVRLAAVQRYGACQALQWLGARKSYVVNGQGQEQLDRWPVMQNGSTCLPCRPVV